MSRQESGDVTGVLPAEPHMLDVLQGFVHELRTAGLPVSMTENLDAMRAIEYVPIEDRGVVQGRARRHAREARGPLPRVRDRVRGLLLDVLARRERRRRAGARRRRAEQLRPAPRRDGSGRRDGAGLQRGARADAPRRAHAHGPERNEDARGGSSRAASPAWNRADRLAARTTSTARCVSSTPTASSAR